MLFKKKICQAKLVIAPHKLAVLFFLNFINTTAYNLGLYEP